MASAEDHRARVLASYGLDELEDDSELVAIVRFAAELTGSPVALVSIVEDERLRFIAREGLDVREAPSSASFCAQAMLGDVTLEVLDARDDPRFANSGLVTCPPHIRYYAGVPLVASDGTPLGTLCVIDSIARPDALTDMQNRGLTVLAQAVMRHLGSQQGQRAAAAQADESARAMRGIADLVPAVVWSADGSGKFDYFNAQWAATTAVASPKTLADWRPSVHADDADRVLGAWEASAAEGKTFESEFRLRHADGTWHWTLSRALPFEGPDGTVARWYGLLTDIDEGRRLSENRDILARELSHRIKNIFAVVSGLISLRARNVPEAGDFARDLIDTIRALGRAHDFVRPTEGAKGNSLRGLLTELMAPYSEGADSVAIAGDECVIGSRAATPLALIFHELATNSAKYGALSVGGGSVAIVIHCPDSAERARITWRERGGPDAATPGKDGFGSRLVKSAMEGQLGGRIERRFAREGLEVDLEIPLASIRS